MDGNAWRAAQAQVQIPREVISPESLVMPSVEVGDWRTRLQPYSRQKIVNKLLETLKRHLPFSGPEGLQELEKIALEFEEKSFTAASSLPDYLRKISLKMLRMEANSQNPITNSMQPSGGSNLQDHACQSIQPQMLNQEIIDGNAWRGAQAQVQIPGQVIVTESLAMLSIEGADWRTQV